MRSNVAYSSLERVLEARHLRRPDVVGHVAAERMARRQVAADVPEFLEVVRSRALGGLDPERRVAARPAAAGDEIFALHLFGQREERLRLLLGAADQRVGDAVVGDDREAVILEAAAELLRRRRRDRARRRSAKRTRYGRR